MDDLPLVINRTALIENLLNQVIEAYCAPRKEVFEFFWNVLLNSSIMPLASKVKVANAISQRLNTKLDNSALQNVMKYRNAFAHHATGAHPVITVGDTPETDELHYTLLLISQSGNVTSERREDALAKFNSSYEAAKKSLVALLDHIRQTSAEASTD